jgi:hypothetical protein
MLQAFLKSLFSFVEYEQDIKNFYYQGFKNVLLNYKNLIESFVKKNKTKLSSKDEIFLQEVDINIKILNPNLQ